MNTEHATPELFAALAKAQSEIDNASKNASNPHFKSKYADLAEVLTTIRDTLPKHGLSLLQSPSFDGAMASVTTIVAHSSGGYIMSVASCVPAKSDAQGIGAATTYLRRYSAAAMAGIAQEDDDGNSAAHDRRPVVVAGRPMDGVWDSMDDDQKQWITEVSTEVSRLFGANEIEKARTHIANQNMATDEKAALWSLLPSPIRTALKKADEAARAKATKLEKAA